MKGISIIIPTYNRAKFVRESILSILNQDYAGPIEIIISDDGSIDETLDIVSSFGTKVQILKKPKICKSQGASGARNRGIQKSTQPYICLLDSDDFYLPGHLNKMVMALESKPEYSFALCNSLLMLDEDRENRFMRWTKSKIHLKDIQNLSISSNNFANSNGFIFKKEVFESIGLFNERYKIGEDSDMWMRINENFKGIHADHYGSVIRMHSLQRLTDLPKHYLLQNHYDVFRSAIKRYHHKGMNDKYRLLKLWFLCFKYRISGLPGFVTIYRKIGDFNKNKINKAKLEQSWKPLKAYVNESIIIPTELIN